MREVQEVIPGFRAALRLLQNPSRITVVVGLLATLIGCELQVVSVKLTGLRDGERIADVGSRAIGVTLTHQPPDSVTITHIDFIDGQATRCTVTQPTETCVWSFDAEDNGVHSWKAVIHLSHGEPWISPTVNVEVAAESPHALPRPSGDTGLVGFMPGIGTANDVVVQDGLAYMASEQFGLSVVDVSTPDQPRLLGSAEAPFIGERVAVRGDVAVVGGKLLDGTSRLWVLDVTDIRMPRIRAQLSVDTAILDLELDDGGNRAIAAMGGLGVRTFDITNRRSPTLIGTYNTPGTAYGLDRAGSFAYVADGTGGLQILDHTGVNGPTFIGAKSLGGVMRDVSVNDDIAYLADQQGSMKIVDVSAPATPQLLYSTGLDSLGRQIEVDGTVAAVLGLNNDGSGGVRVSFFSLANPSRPQFIGSSDFENGGGLALASGRAYVAAASEQLLIYAAGSPSATPVSLKDTFEARVVAERNGLILVGGLNLATPTGHGHMRLVAHTAAGAELRGELSTVLAASQAFLDIAINETATVAVAAMGVHGIWVIDISDPAVPRHVGTYDSPGTTYGVAVEGTLAYLADGSGPLQIVDFSSPNAPSLVAWVSLSGVMRDVAVQDGTAYLSNQQGSLKVVDVSHPTTPTQRYSTGINSLGRSLTVENDRLVISGLINDRTGGMRIDLFDLSDPDRPSLTDSTDLGLITGLTLDQGVAYVGTGPEGVKLLDVSGTTSTMVDALPSFGNANDVVVEGRFVYVADSAATVSIFEL